MKKLLLIVVAGVAVSVAQAAGDYGSDCTKAADCRPGFECQSKVIGAGAMENVEKFCGYRTCTKPADCRAGFECKDEMGRDYNGVLGPTGRKICMPKR